MCNRFLSNWRQYVLLAVVASLALTPLFGDAKDRFTAVVEGPRTSEGLQMVDPSDGQEQSGSAPKIHTLYARSNFVWPYAQTTPYGRVTGERLHEQGLLLTMVGAIPIAELEMRLPAELQTTDRLHELGLQYFILDLDRAYVAEGGVRELSGRLATTGSAVVGGMRASAVVARLTQAGMIEAQADPGVRTIAPLHPALKLHPDIGRTPLPNPVQAVSEVYSLDIELWRGEDGNVVAGNIIDLGGEVTVVAGRTIHASIHRSKLRDVASIQAVASIREWIPNRQLGEETTIMMQTGGYQGRGTIGPYHNVGINGSGNGIGAAVPQVLLVVDSGVQLDAGDLANQPGAIAAPAGPSHRKVTAYRRASDFGGLGDLLGCDAGPQGGETHGHIVSAVAVGNATNIVDTTTWASATTYTAKDTTENDWALDGVAPGAKVAVIDASVTPGATSCNDPTVAGITIGGNYYTGANPTAVCPGSNCPGFLQVGYRTTDGYSARVYNLSYGSANNYFSDARQIDAFLYDKQDALLFAAAGNSGQDFDNDGKPDLGSVIAPSTNKNGVSVGASSNAVIGGGGESRAGFSSVGPARVGTIQWEADPVNSRDRVQPILMAPGTDGGGLGLVSDFTCRTNDNDQDGPVECDITDGNGGTSFASPAAAGSALLVRDYFAQGYHPSGSQITGNAIGNVSGALVKAMLVASADFLNGNNVPTRYRFNNEQGYGRIQLDNVLPLQTWAPSASGLLIVDGGIPGGQVDITGLGNTIDGTTAGTTHTGTFQVCNPDEELRVALVWMDKEVSGDDGQLNTDLDLELVAPDNITVYYGNYFTDDDNRDDVIDTAGADAEDCPDIKGVTGNVDSSQWSLPSCNRGTPLYASPHDVANNTEAIYLTNDYDGDGTDTETDPDPADDDQVVPGTWTIRVKTKSVNPDGTTFVPDTNADSAQRYAVVVAGGACAEASVKWDFGQYNCNAEAKVVVSEILPFPVLCTAGGAAAEVADRATIQVYDGATLVDTETTTLSFSNMPSGSNRYESDALVLTDQTDPTPGAGNNNGVLDVRDGYLLRVTYDDRETAASPTCASSTTIVSEARVNCQLSITSGAITFGQFGFDTGIFVNGGCERNARGLFEFGFPDRYLDEDERLILSVAIGSQEADTINDMDAALRCVVADDTLAPEDCLPGTTPTASCPNPDRILTGGSAMTPCPTSEIQITNSPIRIDSLPAASAIGINYNVVMGSSIANSPSLPYKEVEFVLELTSPTSGKGGTAVAVFRTLLDADELAVLYSTDFPYGGTENADWNNNELLEGRAGATGFCSVSTDLGCAVTADCPSGTCSVDTARACNATNLPCPPTTGSCSVTTTVSCRLNEDCPGAETCTGTSAQTCNAGTAETCTTATVTEPAFNLNDFTRDYRFETRVFSSLDATFRNSEVTQYAPWNFNENDGGFRNGIGAVTDDDAIVQPIAQWGEDKNFNNIFDGFCSVGRCSSGSGPKFNVPCSIDAQCPGGFCQFDAQGWCGGVVGDVQCEAFDDPGDTDLTPEDCEGDIGFCENGGTCSISTTTCTRNADCPTGTCAIDSLQSCNTNVDCRQGGCQGGTSAGLDCWDNTDCAAAGGICVGGGGRCTGGTPETCSGADPCSNDGQCAGIGPETCDYPGNTCDLTACRGNLTNTCPPLLGSMRCESESEDIDPPNKELDSAWSVGGGCGWQTAEAGTCTGGGAQACYIDDDCPPSQTCTLTAPSRGMWHTGNIGSFGATNCLVSGNTIGSCQGIETVGGDEGIRTWFELLLTPEIKRVDVTADRVNIMQFAWNQAIDLADSNAAWTWEIDGDTSAINPVDLTSDGSIFGIGFGGYTPRGGTDGTSQNNPDLTNGFSMFAPVTGPGTTTQNGSFGTNRHGQNACYLDGSIAAFPPLTLTEFGLAGPLDDDLNNGYCPGDRSRMCHEYCFGGTGAVDKQPCSTTMGRDAVCIGGGGTCVDDSGNPAYNNCDTTLICNGSNQCENTAGAEIGFACTVAADCYTCIFPNTDIDEYVTANGPIRNMDPTAFNGPDLRFFTVEDVAGETKDAFQAAIGIVNFEKEDPSANDPETSYGLGVEDVVIEWREITLVADATDCTATGGPGNGGACANIDSSVGATFNSASFLDITVQDATPSNNDCNDDGDNTDPGDNKDCNGNGIPDVRITGKSENEPAGERLTLDCSDGIVNLPADCATDEYFGSLPVSATYDSPGVVFVQSQGTDNPVVEINYYDYDDGTGQICQNSLLPEANGLVQAFTTIVLTGGNVALVDVAVTDNGDGDVWADTNETVTMTLTLRNQTGIQLNNVQARLATGDPKIDCIIDPVINVGSMDPDDPATLTTDEGIKITTTGFTFRIKGTANRLGKCSVATAKDCSDEAPGGGPFTCDTTGGEGTCDAELKDYSATLNVYLSSDEFDTAFVDQVVTLPLDLDASGGGIPVVEIEGFNGALSASKFGIDNMDSAVVGADPNTTGAVISTSGGGGGSLAASDDFRCSFADPDYVNAFTYGDADCYMGVDATHANNTWWDRVTERTYEGTGSLAYTVFIDDTLGFTTPTGVMEAVQTKAPYALGYQRVCTNAPGTVCEGIGDAACPTGAAGLCQPPKPRASWKHQVSLLDFRTVNASGPLRSADGGVIHVQLGDPATLGASSPALGDWIKVETVANQYDSQREDNYNVCSFDPIDDGNNEDSFFDDTDPFKRYGPSSTCFPEFSYTYMGDTDSPFDPANIGNASQGPGLEGANGPGTWVQSVVDLNRFRGQYVRVRMLVSALKLDETWYAAFNYSNTIPGDDGWWIDDFRILDAISSPADLDGDAKPNIGLCAGDGTTQCSTDPECAGPGGPCNLFPVCGAACTTINAAMVADPAVPLAAPGQVVELDALTSAPATTCSGGVLQYRFWRDNDDGGTGSYEAGTDTLLRNWSENAVLLQAPALTSNFAVDVRCSSATTCADTEHLTVEVNCPGLGAGPDITALATTPKGTFSLTGQGSATWTYAEGTTFPAGPTYTTCATGSGSGSSHTMTCGGWVLFRTDPLFGTPYCNTAPAHAKGSWGSTARDSILP